MYITETNDEVQSLKGVEQNGNETASLSDISRWNEQSSQVQNEQENVFINENKYWS